MYPFIRILVRYLPNFETSLLVRRAALLPELPLLSTFDLYWMHQKDKRYSHIQSLGSLAIFKNSR